MAYKISDDCISCGACAENCPTEAIYEADGKYEIDADKCIDCGSCADACPVEAPKAESFNRADQSVTTLPTSLLHYAREVGSCCFYDKTANFSLSFR